MNEETYKRNYLIGDSFFLPGILILLILFPLFHDMSFSCNILCQFLNNKYRIFFLEGRGFPLPIDTQLWLSVVF